MAFTFVAPTKWFQDKTFPNLWQYIFSELGSASEALKSLKNAIEGKGTKNRVSRLELKRRLSKPQEFMLATLPHHWYS